MVQCIRVRVRNLTISSIRSYEAAISVPLAGSFVAALSVSAACSSTSALSVEPRREAEAFGFVVFLTFLAWNSTSDKSNQIQPITRSRVKRNGTSPVAFADAFGPLPLSLEFYCIISTLSVQFVRHFAYDRNQIL